MLLSVGPSLQPHSPYLILKGRHVLKLRKGSRLDYLFVSGKCVHTLPELSGDTHDAELFGTPLLSGGWRTVVHQEEVLVDLGWVLNPGHDLHCLTPS